ncbi:hypothetical protein P4O66_001841 [Electrophorus voltai]|uniref:Reverse transcriptase domain-containing protein n=1 Tax=Electrophorus voltai TaxID=2609070 RepID=A0AAD9DSZ9_9TELE|nr:hypothetical protein P4O66_001841 [Electrophorus voltai]
MRSLDNKLDDLQARIKFQRDIRDCKLLCFTKLWRNPAVLRHAVQPAEFFSVHRMDRIWGKSRGGGVCVMINNSWCSNANVVTFAHSCSPNLELLALKFCSFYLPHEFTSAIVNTVYIPPQATLHCVNFMWLTHSFRATIKTFPNQNPWVDKTIREARNSHTAAYNAGIISGNMDEYKSAAYGMRRVLRESKRHYGRKLEPQVQQSGSRSLWQGLWMITDYRSPPPGLMSADESLANELNTFFARFEATSSSANSNSASTNNANGAIGTADSACAEPTIGQHLLIIMESDVRRVFKRVNTRKAAGPDGFCNRVLKACADQLAPVFTDIFNLSLMLGIIPSCFKQSTIIPVPKKPRPSSLNDYRPVALTSVVMKCFEKLVRDFITSSLPASMDPLQFAHHHNRSTDDTITHLLHTTLTHMDRGRGNYVKMLFVNYSSAFNTIIPSRLTTKLEDLGLLPSLCDWISNFLTDKPQSYTYNCVATSSSTIIVKFADDTVLMGLFLDNDERVYLEETKHLENWCQENNLLLNVSKTKKLIVDCSKKQE